MGGGEEGDEGGGWESELEECPSAQETPSPHAVMAGRRPAPRRSVTDMPALASGIIYDAGEGVVTQLPFCLLPPTMLLKAAPLLLLPFAAAAGSIHKLKLNKVPRTPSNPELEVAYLAEKYGGVNQLQQPMLGAGGVGRNVRLARPTHSEDGEELFWTQEELLNGGHTVPLSSTSSYAHVVERVLIDPRRLLERAVLRRDHPWHACAVVQGDS